MIARADLVELLKPDHPAPCVSIYLPMQRRFPEQQQNEIRYRNLLKQVEAAERRTDVPAIDGGVMVPLRDLLDDGALWAHPQDGLAVFAAPGFFRAYLLPRTVPEQAVVAATFQIKPLLRIVQAADRYQVLALNRVRIRLYEGNRDQLEQIDLAPGVPATIEEALGEELTEEQVPAVRVAGATCSRARRPGACGMVRDRRETRSISIPNASSAPSIAPSWSITAVRAGCRSSSWRCRSITRTSVSSATTRSWSIPVSTSIPMHWTRTSCANVPGAASSQGIDVGCKR
jgi:hypothetical protein